MIFISSRYIYIIAATSDTNFGRLAKWLTLNSNFHIYLTVLGLTMTAFHGISTIFLASDQFFFDQGKRRYFDQKRFCTEMYEKNFWVKILVQNWLHTCMIFSLSETASRAKKSDPRYSNAYLYGNDVYVHVSRNLCDLVFENWVSRKETVFYSQ